MERVLTQRLVRCLRLAGEWDPLSLTPDTTHPVLHQDQILAYAWHMKKNGRPEVSIKTTVRRLTVIAKRCNITDPEQVKAVLATEEKWSNGYKENIVWSYHGLLEFLGLKWQQPHYERQRKIPYIPTEQELDALISASCKRLATLLQFLKETAARSGEASQAKWTDIDTQRKLVYIKAEKGSMDRYLPLSDKLITMLNTLPRPKDFIFTSRVKSLRRTFEETRNRLADKTANPRLRQIHLHTFRHWKATTLYHRTRDIYIVKEFLGHQSVKSTEIYIHIDKMLSNYTNDEYTSVAAKTAEEAMKLINEGFTKADEFDGLHIYRKRK